jgi:hypothetical protein
MTRTLISLLVLLPIAAIVAWYLGFETPRGVAVLVGYGVGSAVSWWGIFYQRHTMMHRPERMSSATVIDFGVKLVVVLVGAIVLRYVPEFAAKCDWRAFLLTFAGISTVVLTFGTVDVVRALAPTTSPANLPSQS